MPWPCYGLACLPRRTEDVVGPDSDTGRDVHEEGKGEDENSSNHEDITRQQTAGHHPDRAAPSPTRQLFVGYAIRDLREGGDPGHT